MENKFLNFLLSISIIFMNAIVLGLSDSPGETILAIILFAPYFMYSRKADFSPTHKKLLILYLVILIISIPGNLYLNSK